MIFLQKGLEVLLVLLPNICMGAIFHDIDTTTPLPCTLSATHQNRILVSEGRIAKVIFPEGSLSIQLEEESGQAFVCAVASLSGSTTLTVVTDRGLVQDIEARFQDGPSEVVILREEHKTSLSEQKPGPWAKMNALLDQLLKGKVPKGYCRFNLRSRRFTDQGLLVHTLASFEGAMDTLYLYQVKNLKYCPVHLQERCLREHGSLWVYLEKHTLDPGEETWAVQALKRMEP